MKDERNKIILFHKNVVTLDHRRRHNFQKSRYGIWPSRKTERPESIEKSIRKKMMDNAGLIFDLNDIRKKNIDS